MMLFVNEDRIVQISFPANKKTLLSLAKFSSAG